ncbi:MAG TPA: DegV family protein [Acidimicrobiia bacterium]|nr:DegV family protein [Acidimicrobiia bacterium]
MIRVVTDSAADLPADIRERLGVTIVPLSVRFGDETFTDGVDLDAATFWSRLDVGSALPETAAPSAGAFMDAFDALAEDGADGIVVVSLSSRLSATHQSAVIAAENVSSRVPVRVVDSRTVSMALGLTVMAAAEAAAAGADLSGVAAAATDATDRVDIVVALDTLEFLKRGGRVGGAQALIGGLLDVKPLITVEDGVVAAAGRVRTRSKARAAIIELATANSDASHMAVIHGRADDIDEVATTIRDLVGDHVFVAELGPVVGTHAGPGTIGVAYQRV